LNSFVKLRRALRCFDPDVMRAIVSAFRSVSEKADQAHCGRIGSFIGRFDGAATQAGFPPRAASSETALSLASTLESRSCQCFCARGGQGMDRRILQYPTAQRSSGGSPDAIA
jgi:hypothetical protein